MSYRNREIETKLVTHCSDLSLVNQVLEEMFGATKERMLFGSSLDLYWEIRDEKAHADFLRVRERDGSVQITVKGKDRDTNLNRMEREFLTTDNLDTVTGVFTSVFGNPTGRVGKTYYVYWLDKHTTVCCYRVTDPVIFDKVIIEVESTSKDRVLTLTTQVLETLGRKDIYGEQVPWSLYERFVLGGSNA